MADVTYCIRKARGGGWSFAVAGGSGPGSAGKSATYGKARESALARARAAGGSGEPREWADGPCTHGVVKAASAKARTAAVKGAAPSAGIRCSCGTRNRAAASFCAGCGQSLMAVKSATAQAAALAKIAADTARLFGVPVPVRPAGAAYDWRAESDPATREHMFKAASGLLAKGA